MKRYPSTPSPLVDSHEFDHRWRRRFRLSFVKAICFGLTSEDIPSLVGLTAPPYPREAKDQRVMGKVVIQVSIGSDGLPDRIFN